MTKLMIISASTRPGRVGLPIARWIQAEAEGFAGFESIDFVDLAELALPFLDEPKRPAQGQYTKEHTLQWSARVDAADAFVIVMPEYNFGMNAPLKNALDFLYREWSYKAAGLVSYGGVSGGTRAAQMAKLVLQALKMTAVDAAVTIPFVGRMLDEQREFQPTERITTAAAAMFRELLRVDSALRVLRTPQP